MGRVTEDVHSMDTPGGDITSPDGESMRFEPYDWQRALSASVAAHADRQAVRRAERTEFARRRDCGLKRRHAAKLAHLQPLPSEQRMDTEPTVSQTETDDPRSQQ